VEITRILIAAGAYVNAKAYLYGGYYTTMAMLISSAHSRDAGVQDALIKVFLEAGASSETTH
ncbi:MAG: ankyrin repeat domain-containing protein, partial [bacterium]